MNLQAARAFQPENHASCDRMADSSIGEHICGSEPSWVASFETRAPLAQLQVGTGHSVGSGGQPKAGSGKEDGGGAQEDLEGRKRERREDLEDRRKRLYRLGSGHVVRVYVCIGVGA